MVTQYEIPLKEEKNYKKRKTSKEGRKEGLQNRRGRKEGNREEVPKYEKRKKGEEKENESKENVSFGLSVVFTASVCRREGLLAL